MEFDKGSPSSESFTGNNFLFTAISGVLGGKAELPDSTFADVARSLAPAGAAVPVASMFEFPDGRPSVADLHDPEGGSLLPVGDARDDLVAGEPRDHLPALEEWHLGVALGLGRMLLREALAGSSSPSVHVGNAMFLLYLADGIRRLRTITPDGQFDLLPKLFPPFFGELLAALDDDSMTGRPRLLREFPGG